MPHTSDDSLFACWRHRKKDSAEQEVCDYKVESSYDIYKRSVIYCNKEEYVTDDDKMEVSRTVVEVTADKEKMKVNRTVEQTKLDASGRDTEGGFRKEERWLQRVVKRRA